MKTKVRPALFLVGAIGFVCLGYAFAFGLKNGFGFSWEGNWDPVVIGIVGVALVSLAATVNAVVKLVGVEKRENLARSVLRALAVSLLAFMKFAGVFLAAWGFTLFFAFENAGQNGLLPFCVTVGGILANRIAALLMPYVREKRGAKEMFLSVMEDDHET